jgi:Mrp family chromosome partitioning ATPase
MNEPGRSVAPQEEKLPFHLPTLLRGVWRRRRWLLKCLGISIALGLVGGWLLGSQTYEADTVLIFESAVGDEMGSDRGVQSRMRALRTSLDMVKLKANLEEVRKRLALETSLDQIGQAASVTVPANTSLMTIRVSWNSPKGAADIANTLRQVFLESVEKVRAERIKKVMDFEKVSEEVSSRLQQADTAFKDFTTREKIVDLDKQTQWYLQELTSTEQLLRDAEFEKKKLDLQLKHFDSIINDLKQKAGEEQVASQATESLGEINIRFRRLRDAIHDDRAHRAGVADLSQKELEYNKAKRLYERDLIPRIQYERAKAEYERTKALTVDTEQIKKWKSEIKKLDKVVIPSKGSSSTSAKMLQEMMLKSFEIQLQHVAAEEKVQHLTEARKKSGEKLAALNEQQREYITLSRKVEALETEKKTVEELVAQTRRAESQSPQFSLVSEAQVPEKPLRSTVPLFIVAITGFGIFSTVAVVLGLELADTTIKSQPELALKLDRPVLGAIGKMDHSGHLPAEPFKIICRHIRNRLPKKGARILVVSGQTGEGKTTLAINLAQSFGRQEERVLLVDAQVSKDSRGQSFRDLVDPDGSEIRGLGEYLSFEVDSPDEIIYPTELAGVESLPHVGQAVIMELLGSNRMKDLLDQLSKRYSLIFIESQSVLSHADTEMVGQFVDAAILVIRAQRSKMGALRETLRRLEAVNVPILGLVLNGVDQLYLST